MSEHKVEFANLVIKFGDEDMLDHPEIIFPVFMRDTLVRGYGGTTYHFMDQQFLSYENDASLYITGRFVKSQKLQREQYIEGGALKRDSAVLDTAPSAIFLLDLLTHRIAYAHETRFAPSLEQFRATVQRFAIIVHNQEAKRSKKERNESGHAITWEQMRLEYPAPSVNLTPLPNDLKVEQAIEQFRLIKRLKLTLIDRNSEYTNAGEDAGNFRKRLTFLAPVRAVTEVVGGKDGLVKQEAKAFIHETAEAGYEQIVVKGVSEEGQSLTITNEDMKLVERVELSPVVKTSGKRLRELFIGLLTKGDIKVSLTNERRAQLEMRISELRQRYGIE